MRLYSTFLLAAACILAASGPASPLSAESGQSSDSSEEMHARETIDRSFELDPGASVSVSGIAGPVTVETATGSQAQVHIVRMARSERELACYRTRVEGNGSTLTIDHVQDRSPECRSIDLRQEVRLVLPRHSDLNMSSVAGRVVVGELDGALRLESIAGSVTLAGARSAEIESVAGRLSLTIGALDSPGIHISSVAGAVALAFRADANADVAIDSVIGRVRSDSPRLRIQGEDNDYRVRVGTGGPRLVISSVVGSVSIAAQ